MKNKQGGPRNSMVWHFPHGVAQQSTIRTGGWKLIKNWMRGRPEYELYQLQSNYPKNPKRGDIEEAKNLADEMPGKVKEMSAELFRRLDSMKASYPYQNPNYKFALPGKDQVCKPLKNGRKGNNVWAKFEERGARVINGQLLYTLNGGEKSEEWYRVPAIVKGDLLTAELPKGSTHYVFNLIDENNFLVSYPQMVDMLTAGSRKPKGRYSMEAFPVKQ